MTPRVSVIMPAYNVEAFVAESIESVLAQTYRDYELVVVDDGSLDGTPALLQHYATAHPDRIRIVVQENCGPSRARNAALRVAVGSVYAFLDSDDVWAPAYLAEQMRILDTEIDVDIVTGNAFLRGGAGDGRTARPFPDPRPAPDLMQILLDDEAVFIMTVLRREVVDSIGGFDEDLFTNEDYDLWIRAARAGFRFRRNPRPLGWYRCRLGSLSSNTVRMLTGIVRVYRKALADAEPGSAIATVIEQQIARFDAERLAAEARLAIENGDAAVAAEFVDALKTRRGGWSLHALSFALHHTPRAALWAWRARRQLQLDDDSCRA
jgi:glycosyltransferase involved in cell wall biosynthesis